jgi:hypothetical protein
MFEFDGDAAARIAATANGHHRFLCAEFGKNA